MRKPNAISLAPLQATELVCIGCGCTESSACRDASGLSPNGNCFWIAIDEEAGRGLCSSCVVKPIDELIPQAKVLVRPSARIAGIGA
jgi:hypothetical protein